MQGHPRMSFELQHHHKPIVTHRTASMCPDVSRVRHETLQSWMAHTPTNITNPDNETLQTLMDKLLNRTSRGIAVAGLTHLITCHIHSKGNRVLLACLHTANNTVPILTYRQPASAALLSSVQPWSRRSVASPLAETCRSAVAGHVA